MQTGKLAIGCSIHGVDAKAATPAVDTVPRDSTPRESLI